ncbi:MAG: hypothetical protein Q8R11_03675 [bacterium]|nr:hypothetical protein [bacterium]
MDDDVGSQSAPNLSFDTSSQISFFQKIRNILPDFSFLKIVFPLVVILTLLGGIVVGVNIAQKRQTTSGRTDDQIARLTTQLQEAIQDGTISNPTIATIVLVRKQQLLEEIQTSPEAFLSHAQLANTRDQFPVEMQGNIERKIDVVGTLHLLHSDTIEENENGETVVQASASTMYVLETFEGELLATYTLHFVDPPPDEANGAFVQLSGIVLDKEIVIPVRFTESPDQLNSSLLEKLISRAFAEEDESIEVISPPAATLTPQLQQQEPRIAVISGYFRGNNPPDSNNNSFGQNVTEALYFNTGSMQGRFGQGQSVREYYLENTYNRISITGEYFGPFELPVTEPSFEQCEIFTRGNDLFEAARNAGISFDGFTHILFQIPCGSNYSYSVGDHLYISLSGSDLQVVIHELGHSFGLNHAARLYCQNGTSIDRYENCTLSEYGDTYDPMGRGRCHMNAPHKIGLEALDSGNIQFVRTNGSYRLEPYEIPGLGVKVLKIPKPDTNEFYYVEYRQPIGLDRCVPFSGGLIHIWDERNESLTKLVDSTPSTGTLGDFDIPDNDEWLTDGTSFIDQINNISIRQVSHNDTELLLDVQMPTVPKFALYEVNPPTTWGLGQTQTYSITLTNAGSETWTSTGPNPINLGVSFGDESDIPAIDWATDQRFSLPNDVTPGESVTMTISVTAPATKRTTRFSYKLRHRLVHENIEWFPQMHKTNVWILEYLDSANQLLVPTRWAAGETKTYAITMENIGGIPWNNGGANPVNLGVSFGSADDTPGINWTMDQRIQLQNSVPPGERITMYINVTAPNQSGTYYLRHRLVEENVGWATHFTKTQVTVVEPINASYTFPQDAESLLRWTIGEPQQYSVVLSNNGIEPWIHSGGNRVQLGVNFGGSDDTAGIGWVTDQRFLLPNVINPSNQVTLTVNVQSPNIPGRYYLRHRLVKEGIAWSPSMLKLEVEVKKSLDVSFEGTPPETWPVGYDQTYEISLTNNGFETWNRSGENPFRLGVSFGSENDTPGIDWILDQRFDIPSDVNPGETIRIEVTVQPNIPAGSYYLRHRLVKENIGWSDSFIKQVITVNNP